MYIQVTGHEKFIYYDTSKRKKSVVKPGQFGGIRRACYIMNAWPHIARPVENYLKNSDWEVLPQSPFVSGDPERRYWNTVYIRTGYQKLALLTHGKVF